MPPLPRSFFARDVILVARDLLGRHLAHDGVVLRITECEAYGGPDDSASHCRFGRTARNAPMWGPPGHAYVYLCYGVHWMLNLVTGAEGRGQAILVRAAEIVDGAVVVLARRARMRVRPDLLAGPGKVAQALALDATFNAHDVCARGGLEARAGRSVDARDVVVGARIGVDYAAPRDRKAPLRFALGGSRAVTHRRGLRFPR